MNTGLLTIEASKSISATKRCAICQKKIPLRTPRVDQHYAGYQGHTQSKAYHLACLYMWVNRMAKKYRILSRDGSIERKGGRI